MCACGIFSLQSTKEKGARSVNVIQLTTTLEKGKKGNGVYTIFLFFPSQAADTNLMKKAALLLQAETPALGAAAISSSQFSRRTGHNSKDKETKCAVFTSAFHPCHPSCLFSFSSPLDTSPGSRRAACTHIQTNPAYFCITPCRPPAPPSSCITPRCVPFVSADPSGSAPPPRGLTRQVSQFPAPPAALERRGCRER